MSFGHPNLSFSDLLNMFTSWTCHLPPVYDQSTGECSAKHDGPSSDFMTRRNEPVGDIELKIKKLRVVKKPSYVEDKKK